MPMKVAKELKVEDLWEFKIPSMLGVLVNI